MKATLRLMIVAAVLVSAQMSFASTDPGSVTPPCKDKLNTTLSANTTASTNTVTPSTSSNGSGV